MLADEGFAVLQDLVLGVEEAEPVRIHAAGLLGKAVLDILHRCGVGDVDAGGQLFDRLFGGCEGG